MTHGRDLCNEMLDMHRTFEGVEGHLSKGFVYLFFQGGLPAGSKKTWHGKFHEDPSLAAWLKV